MLLTRPERPWALCALCLFFLLTTLYNKKNGPAVPQPLTTSQISPELIPKRPAALGSLSTLTAAKEASQPDQEDYDEYDEDGQDGEMDEVDEETTDTVPATTAVNLDNLPDIPPTDFMFCTEPHITLHNGRPNHTLDIAYQCEGPLYRSFAGNLRTFSNDMVTTGAQDPKWGHRREGLPAKRKYLFLGNSHTRQTAMALLCQLNVTGSQGLEPSNMAMARRFDLHNGAQVYLVVNSFVVHSPNWVKLLAQQIGVPLTDFDAIVMGVFNTCNADRQTTYAADMKALADEEKGVDCINQEGPTLRQVADVYSGPLLYVSMFATYRYKAYSVDERDAKVLHAARPNLVYLDARHYIKLYGLPECGSSGRNTVTDCVHGEKARRKLHRCVGRYGGHPDLIAWDVAEFLYKHAD